jgi:hypothetical protein
MRHALPDVMRRPYVFIGGRFEGADWVCGTGDIIGTFAHDLFAIPALIFYNNLKMLIVIQLKETHCNDAISGFKTTYPTILC